MGISAQPQLFNSNVSQTLRGRIYCETKLSTPARFIWQHWKPSPVRFPNFLQIIEFFHAFRASNLSLGITVAGQQDKWNKNANNQRQNNGCKCCFLSVATHACEFRRIHRVLLDLNKHTESNLADNCWIHAGIMATINNAPEERDEMEECDASS